MGTNASLNAQQIPASGFWKFQKDLHSFSLKSLKHQQNWSSVGKQTTNEWPEYFREHNSKFQIYF